MLSGPGPGDRDPQRIGVLVDGVASEGGWEVDLAVGSLAGRWAELVGADVAAHCRPEKFDSGELVLVAESTAWATQLRLLAPTLVSRIAAGVGPDIVRRVVVHGPSAPSWRRGPWRVAGRGPRDTYG
jgi:predicted nucleic acid-binding Zn ribbon protein